MEILKLTPQDRHSIDFAESERQKSKNLFDVKNGLDITQKGLQVSISNNITTVSGTVTGNTAVVIYNSVTKLYKDKTYTISFQDYSNLSNFKIAVTGTRPDGTKKYDMLNIDSSKVVNTITCDDDYSLAVEVYCLANATPTGSFKLQLEEGTVATDYQPYAGGQIARFGDIVGLKGTVLWENPDTSINVPGTKFASQTITLNSNDYDEFEMIYYMSSSNSRTLSVKYLKGEYGVAMCGTTTHSSGAVAYVRNCNVTDNYSKVFFENAWEAKGATAEVSQNTCCIPLKIIGYKRS